MANRFSIRSSVRLQVGALLVVCLFLAALLDQVFDRAGVMPSFEALEREEAVTDLERCLKALKREVYHLATFARDWGAWDDTYEFIADHNQDYIDGNMVHSTFTDNALNLMCFLDSEGNVVWGGAMDIEEEEYIDYNALIDLPLPFEVGEDPDTSPAGVYVTSRGPMILCAAPILTSNNEGPSRGVLIMGRLLTEELQERLRSQTEVDFQLVPLSADSAKTTLPEAAVGNEGEVQVVAVAKDYLELAHAMEALNGGWLLEISAKVPRHITERGRHAVLLTTLVSMSTNLAILLVLFAALHWLVVSPLLAMAGRITAIRDSGRLSERVDTKEKNEIGVVGREFDHLLDRVEEQVAEQERSAQALRESEARIRALHEAAPDAILSLNEDGVIESANPAAASMFGMAHEALAGTPLDDLVVDSGCSVAALTRDGRGITRKDLTARTKSGREFPIYLSMSGVAAGGDKTLFVAIIRDMTEYREMHERMLRIEHLAAIGEMAAAVAHEIRNPLAGIGSAVEVMAGALPENDPRREVVGELREQVLRVDNTVRSLLMFARPWTPEPARCDVRGMLEDACESARKSVRFDGIAVELDVDGQLEMVADCALCRQVLWNLLVNAAQATPSGGAIRVEARREGETVFISVTDTGAGMPEDVAKKAFSPFFTTRTQGSGLGLTICRQIVEAHNGVILAKTKPGEGTTMTLCFPQGELNGQSNPRS